MGRREKVQVKLIVFFVLLNHIYPTLNLYYKTKLFCCARTLGTLYSQYLPPGGLPLLPGPPLLLLPHPPPEAVEGLHEVTLNQVSRQNKIKKKK